MARLTVTLTLASPLQSNVARQGNILESRGYLPGSTLRGALAATVMRDWSAAQRQITHPDNCPDRSQCELCRIFYPLDGAAPRFYDCYPALEGSDVVYPFPLSARTCKYFPGFIDQNAPADRHGIFDTLIRQTVASRAGADLPYQYEAICPHCHEQTVQPGAGQYALLAGSYYSALPIERRFSRTAIDRTRQAAEPGQLFTLSVLGDQMRISPPLQFGQSGLGRAVTTLIGAIDAGGADNAPLQTALQQLSSIGSGASRGLGHLADVAIDEAVDDQDISQRDFMNQFKRQAFQSSDASGPLARLAAFNRLLADERAFYRKLGADPLDDGLYFALDLLSDSFVTQFGLPSLHWPALPFDAEPIFCITQPVNRGGWSVVRGLPRARRLAIGAGSSFVYRAAASDEPTVRRLLPQLLQLEQDGIGDQRERGAGRLIICAPFHMEIDPR